MDILQGLQTTGGAKQLLSDIQETGNNHLENLYDNEKMKAIQANMEKKIKRKDEMEMHCG